MMGMGMGMNMTPEMLKAMQERAAQARKATEDETAGETADGTEEQAVKPVVDDKMVIDYIMSRQEAVDEARRESRALKAKVSHLEHEVQIANTKVKALQDALAKIREENKTLKAANGQ